MEINANHCCACEIFITNRPSQFLLKICLWSFMLMKNYVKKKYENFEKQKSRIEDSLFNKINFMVLGIKLGHITQGLQVAQFHQSVQAPSSSYGRKF